MAATERHESFYTGATGGRLPEGAVSVWSTRSPATTLRTHADHVQQPMEEVMRAQRRALQVHGDPAMLQRRFPSTRFDTFLEDRDTQRQERHRLPVGEYLRFAPRLSLCATRATCAELRPDDDVLEFFQLDAQYTESEEHGTEIELYGLLRHSSEPVCVRVHGFAPRLWVRWPGTHHVHDDDDDDAADEATRDSDSDSDDDAVDAVDEFPDDDTVDDVAVTSGAAHKRARAPAPPPPPRVPKRVAAAAAAGGPRPGSDAEIDHVLGQLDALLRAPVCPRDYGLDFEGLKRAQHDGEALKYPWQDLQSLRVLRSQKRWITGWRRERHMQVVGYDGERLHEFVRVDVAHPRLVSKLRSLLENPRGRAAGAEQWQGALPQWSHVYERHAFRVFEADVDYVLRFYCDTGLRPTSWLRVPRAQYRTVEQDEDVEQSRTGGRFYYTYARKSSCRQEFAVHVDALCAAPELDEQERPEMTALAFDAEMKSRAFFPHADRDPTIAVGATVALLSRPHLSHTVLFCVGSVAPPADREQHETPLTVFTFATEREMQRHFHAFVLATDCDWLLQYNGNGFDLPYLKERSQQLHLDSWMYLGRSLHRRYYTKRAKKQDGHAGERNADGTKVKYRNFALKMKDEAGVSGRVCLDMVYRMREDQKFESNTLGYTSQQILGTTKKDFNVGLISQFHDDSAQTRRTIALYLEADCYLVLRMFVKLGYVNKFVALSRISRTPVQTCLNRGQEAKVTGRLRAEAHHVFDDTTERHLRASDGVVVPVRLLKECSRGGSSLVDKYKGAAVVVPRRGFHRDPVCTLDFASEYPCIMREFNLCYTSWLARATIRRLGLVEGYDYHRIYQNFDERTCAWHRDDQWDGFMMAPDTPVDESHRPAAGWPRRAPVRKRGLLPGMLDALGRERKRLKGEAARWFDVVELFTRLREGGASQALRNADDWRALRHAYSDLDELERRRYDDALPERPAAGASYTSDERETLAELGTRLRAWAEFQHARLDAEQLAIKFLMNSAYGIMGATVSSWRLRPVARSVTAMGRHRIWLIRGVIEREFTRQHGYPFDAEIVYGDTDSVFVKLRDFEGCVAASCFYGIEMARRMNTEFRRPTSLEFEKVFWNLDLVQRKMYIGCKIELSNMRDQVCQMGLRSKKRGTPPFVKELATEIIRVLALDADTERAYEIARRHLERLMRMELPLGALVKGAGLSKDMDSYDPSDKLVSLAIARKHRERYGQEPRAGDHMTWLVCEGTEGQRTGSRGRLGEKRVSERVEEIGVVLDHPERYRVDRYYYVRETMALVGRLLSTHENQCEHDKHASQVWMRLLGVRRVQDLALPQLDRRLDTVQKKQRNVLTRFVRSPDHYCALCGGGVFATEVARGEATAATCVRCHAERGTSTRRERERALRATLEDVRREHDRVWATCEECFRHVSGLRVEACPARECHNYTPRHAARLRRDAVERRAQALDW